MLYAIGTPGGAVRLFVRALDPDDARIQCGPGEVWLPAESEAPSTISADGLTVATTPQEEAA